MSRKVKPEMSVLMQELAPVRVAFVDLAAECQPGEFSTKISAQFQALRRWVQAQRLDPDTLLHIGIPKVAKGQLAGYECCLEAPATIQAGSDGIMRDGSLRCDTSEIFVG